jgi:nucleotide-binding universal stress UspA family protein
MITFSMLVCPVDLSDLSGPALAHTAQIARWYGARVSVLHVNSTVPEERPSFSESAALPPAGASQTPGKDAVRAHVAAALEGVDFTVTLVAGKAAPRIVEHAEAVGADLIVMSTHGRSGFDRLVHGSVTERVLAHAPCPVLTVPPHTATPPHALFRNIICPMDFSLGARHAFDIALDLSRQANGKLRIVHSIEWYPEGEMITVGKLDMDDFRKSLQEQANARLAGLLEQVDTQWVNVEPVVTVGTPHRRVLEDAEATGADLIVMGAQGNDGLDLAVFGSTTRQILAQARVPVLVTRGAP